MDIQLLKKESLNCQVYRFVCKAEKIAGIAKAGQFISIQVVDSVFPFLLRRPVSIYNIDSENGNIEFIFQQRGIGTKLLADKVEGDVVDVLGPLGRGFDLSNCNNIAIIGGGIGVFPLHQLAKEAVARHRVSVFLGFKNKSNVMLENEFKKVSTDLTICTDNGTYGQHGCVTDFVANEMQARKFDGIFACGPLPMLRAVGKIAQVNGVFCQISLEEKMGCTIGACMGCSVKLNTPVKYGRVCKDGPVFNSKDVVINLE